jgi:hypothetical protein
MTRQTSWVEWAGLTAIIVGYIILFCICTKPAGAQVSNAQPNQVEINAQVAYGLGYQSNSVLMNYIEPGTTTALFGNSATVFVPASTTDQVVNLATLFPYINSAELWAVEDISNPGQSVLIGTATGSNKFTLAPGGFFEARVYGSAPTLYISNPSTNQYAILKFINLAN